jgi:hypothetical protein
MGRYKTWISNVINREGTRWEGIRPGYLMSSTVKVQDGKVQDLDI